MTDNPELSKARLFEAERHETDNSLDAERAKATHSLNTANARSQVQTDEIVKDERSIADQQTASSRAEHDGAREASSSTPTDQAADAQLAEERRRTDVATGVERLRMDEVMLAERKTTSNLVAKVLEQERIATDRNLLVERNTTDAECVGSSTLLQNEIANHKKTQVALTSREEFLAIVSHDLRNPIGAISSYAELILEGNGDTVLGPETTQFVLAIKRSADISIRLISDLLDLERISEDKLLMNFAKCDAAHITKTAIDIFRPIAAERNISLNVEMPDSDLTLVCDHDRILQVVSNLIGNALKYTPDDGAVQVSVLKRPTALEFKVQDNGAGIPIEKQTEIFTRFAQLASRDRTGLGLGLYIAKTIVEAHSGNLEVDSQVGVGSTFYFSIPATTAAHLKS